MSRSNLYTNISNASARKAVFCPTCPISLCPGGQKNRLFSAFLRIINTHYFQAFQTQHQKVQTSTFNFAHLLPSPPLSPRIKDLLLEQPPGRISSLTSLPALKSKAENTLTLRHWKEELKVNEGKCTALCSLLAFPTKKEERGRSAKVGDEPNFSFHHNILFANCFIRLLFPTPSCLLVHWKNKQTQYHQKQNIFIKSKLWKPAGYNSFSTFLIGVSR